MKKTVRKIGIRQAAASRPASGGRRKSATTVELPGSKAKDRAAAQSGVSPAGAARGVPATTGEAAREFPDAIYQDDRRT